jgi:hypothetical protein
MHNHTCTSPSPFRSPIPFHTDCPTALIPHLTSRREDHRFERGREPCIALISFALPAISNQPYSQPRPRVSLSISIASSLSSCPTLYLICHQHPFEARPLSKRGRSRGRERGSPKSPRFASPPPGLSLSTVLLTHPSPNRIFTEPPLPLSGTLPVRPLQVFAVAGWELLQDVTLAFVPSKPADNSYQLISGAD